MPRQRVRTTALTTSSLDTPTSSLMAAETGTPSLMAAGAPVVLSVYQGDDKRWLFRLKKDGGTPFVLTGYTALLQFRTGVADSATSGAVTPQVEVSDPINGEITVTLHSEQSKLLTATSYVWDLEITETAASWTTTIAFGTLAVTKEVTRGSS